MHRCATSKIQSTHLRYPTVWIPCPTRNRIVDKCCPYEDEYHARKHATSFGSRADGQRGSYRREHTLEDTESEFGDSHCWLRQHVHESDILKIADEFPSGFRKRE